MSSSPPPFSFIVPLGLRCLTAETFKRRSLRSFALPMDWIYSSLPMVLDCIATNFSSLLDPTQYTKVGQTGKWGACSNANTVALTLVTQALTH